jgi:molybdopterin biosynthesis enzyme
MRRVKVLPRLTHRHPLRHKSLMIEPLTRIQRIERLMPLADALACIERLVTFVTPRPVERRKAFGRCLAGDILTAQVRPMSAIALRDGVAASADATLDASPYAPAPLPGTPVFVEVGDPLPAGADAVAPLDAVELRGAAVRALAALAPGDGVLSYGGDATPGDVLGREGVPLRAIDLAAMAALDLAGDVYVCEPRVRVVTASRERHPVIQAICELLVRVVGEAGGVASIAPPDVAGLESAIADAEQDAIILIGGSGSGRRDRSVIELAKLGSVAFHGVGLAPGETAAFGMIDRRPVLIVPGRLDAALAVWLTLGRRMLARLCDYEIDDRGMPAVLARKIASTLGLAELVPVRREAGGVVPLASGYLPPQALARASGFVLVPADREGFPEGATVEMRPLP